MRARTAISAAILAVPAAAGAAQIAYEGFALPVGSVDGQSGGSGWDPGARVLGAGGTDNYCDNVVCACPEDPADPKVQRGHSGAAWTASALSATHNTVLAAGLTYPGLPVTGGALKLVYAGAPAGGWRSFRTLDTSSAAAQPLAVTYANGPAGAPRATFGKGGTELWMSFLAALDCGGPPCTSSPSGNNGGIHLFDGIGDLDSSGGRDGPKHPFEHLQFGDRNLSDTWIVARTMGQCVAGSGTWQPADATSQGIKFDSTTRLFVIGMRFDVADPAVTPCSNGFSGSGTCTCPAANSFCLDEISVWVDPDLSGPIGAMPATTAASGVLGPTVVADFQFDTVQVGAEGEAIDLDEIRLGTTYADVVTTGTVPVPVDVYRAGSAIGLVAPANLIGSAPAPPYDDVPPAAPLLDYAVDDGAGGPAVVLLVKQAPTGVRISWR